MSDLSSDAAFAINWLRADDPIDPENRKLVADVIDDYRKRVVWLEAKLGAQRQLGRESHQQALMLFDPATGEEEPYPSHAAQWREYHGEHAAWLFNPWTGDRRGSQNVGPYPFGRLVFPPAESENVRAD